MASYRPGERWKYRTRSGEESSTLTVVRVESDAALGVLVHLLVEGVAVLNSRVPSGVQTRISFVPMAESAVDESVTELMGMVSIDRELMAEFEDAYRGWRNSPEGCGAFTIPVRKIVGLLETGLAPGGTNRATQKV